MNEWLKDMKQLNREQAEELYNIAILTITNKVKEQEQQLQAYKDKEDEFINILKKLYKMLDTSSNNMTSLRSAVNETRDKCNEIIDYLEKLKEKE